eukprot:scaffold29481_cov104-Isochrysis_galbana.AAC.1
MSEIAAGGHAPPQNSRFDGYGGGAPRVEAPFSTAGHFHGGYGNTDGGGARCSSEGGGAWRRQAQLPMPQ